MTALLALVPRAHADGGFVALHRTAGSFVVTVFTGDGPARVGPVDFSVLVQDHSNHPVLDAELFVRLRSEDGKTIAGRATRELSQNKMLYSVIIELPEPGQWDLEVTVQKGQEATVFSGQVLAISARPFLLSYWRSLSLPPVVIILFALNQLLKRRNALRKTQQTK